MSGTMFRVCFLAPLICGVLWYGVICCVYAYRGYKSAMLRNRQLDEEAAWLNMACQLRREGRWSEYCEKSEVECT